MCIQYCHPHPSYFQLDCLNLWLEGSFSFLPSCGSLGLALDVVSNIFPRCVHQCCNDCNGCWDLYSVVQWLLSSYIFPLSTSSSPPWNLSGALSASNHLVASSFDLCFLGIVPVHMPHPSFLDLRASPTFVDDCVKPPYT
jgi:hypothetical protein